MYREKIRSIRVVLLRNTPCDGDIFSKFNQTTPPLHCNSLTNRASTAADSMQHILNTNLRHAHRRKMSANFAHSISKKSPSQSNHRLPVRAEILSHTAGRFTTLASRSNPFSYAHFPPFPLTHPSTRHKYTHTHRIALI